MMLSRMADALYWMTRNLERADNTARLVEINLLHLMETETVAEPAQWAPILGITGSRETFHQLHGSHEINKTNVSSFLINDRDYSNSVVNCIRVGRENARVVRDRISKEMWEAVNQMWLALDTELKKPLPLGRVPAFCSRLRGEIARFQGLTQDTMMRGEAYGFYRLGTFIERADMTARILDVKYHILLPTVQPVGSALDYYQWVALLKTLSGFEAFRRTYHAGLRPIDVSEFILFSQIFPRSLRFSVDRLGAALKHIGFESRDQATCRSFGALRTWVEKTTAEEVFRQGLHEYLQEALRRIAALHGSLQSDCFEAYLGGERVAVPN